MGKTGGKADGGVRGEVHAGELLVDARFGGNFGANSEFGGKIWRQFVRQKFTGTEAICTILSEFAEKFGEKNGRNVCKTVRERRRVDVMRR